MAKEAGHDQVDLSESSVYRDDDRGNPARARGDAATETDLERLEDITGGAEEPELYDGPVGDEVEELDASTDEEVDALEVNLLQEDERPARDGSGRVVDDVAEEELAGFTEVGPDVDDRGAIAVEPGRDDTSSALRRHHPHTQTTSVPRSESIVEGNVDEPLDEQRMEPKVDEGSGA